MRQRIPFRSQSPSFCGAGRRRRRTVGAVGAGDARRGTCRIGRSICHRPCAACALLGKIRPVGFVSETSRSRRRCRLPQRRTRPRRVRSTSRGGIRGPPGLPRKFRSTLPRGSPASRRWSWKNQPRCRPMLTHMPRPQTNSPQRPLDWVWAGSPMPSRPAFGQRDADAGTVVRISDGGAYLRSARGKATRTRATDLIRRTRRGLDGPRGSVPLFREVTWSYVRSEYTPTAVR